MVGSTPVRNRSFFCLFCQKPKSIPVGNIQAFKEHMEDKHKVFRDHLVLLAIHFTDQTENNEITDRVKEQLFKFFNSVKKEEVVKVRNVRTYKCPFCEQFVKKGSLITHLLQGHDVFFSHKILVASSLLTHRETEDVIQRIQNKASNMEMSKSMWKLEIYDCKRCGHRFLSEERLALHDENRCLRCKSCFKSSRQLNDPRYHKCLRKIFDCKICGKLLKTDIELEKHEKKHIKKAVFKCEDCTKEFLSSRMLEVHMQRRRNCQGQKTGHIQCDSCAKKFSSIQVLRKHKKVDDCQTIITCENCQKYIKEFSYNMHLITCKVNFTLSDLMCKTCFKRFPDIESFGSHLKTHPEGGIYKCELCVNTFAHKNHVIKHAKIHTKKYKCEHCSKMFHRSKSLKGHMNIHVGGKPWECNRCLKRFHNKEILIHHAKRLHPNQVNEIVQIRKRPLDEEVMSRMEVSENGWNCTECQMISRHKDRVKRHVERVHLKRKPYICYICDKPYSINLLLKNHILRHTGEKPYPCLKCNGRFQSRKNLRLHNKKCLERKPSFLGDDVLDSLIKQEKDMQKCY